MNTQLVILLIATGLVVLLAIITYFISKWSKNYRSEKEPIIKTAPWAIDIHRNTKKAEEAKKEERPVKQKKPWPNPFSKIGKIIPSRVNALLTLMILFFALGVGAMIWPYLLMYNEQLHQHHARHLGTPPSHAAHYVLQRGIWQEVKTPDFDKLVVRQIKDGDEFLVKAQYVDKDGKVLLEQSPQVVGGDKDQIYFDDRVNKVYLTAFKKDNVEVAAWQE